jgi:uncharacterized membrane protein YbhN (UPF0104 family)
MTRVFGTAGRLGVTVILLALLLYRFDVGRVMNIVSHGSVLLFAAATIVLAGATLFYAKRWHTILVDRADIAPVALLKIVFVGGFFNQVLPTAVGGDVVRAWRCHQLGASLPVAIRSVLLDRVCGFVVLVALYLGTLPDLLGIVRNPVQQQMLLLVLGGSIAGLVALCMFDRLPFRVLRLRAIAPLADLSIEGRRVLLTQYSRSATIFGVSVIGMLLMIVSMDLTGRCVGMDLSFARWLAITPPVAIFQLLPLSLGGWGVREASLVILLGTLGIPGETALAASLCIGLSQIVVGLPGGLIWLNNWDIGTGTGVARSTSTGNLLTRLKEVFSPK